MTEHLAYLEAQSKRLQAEIRTHIDAHPGLKQQQDLLQSIPGIGQATSAWLIAELNLTRFDSARSAAAFAGLIPHLHQSGDSLRTRSTLSKRGHSALRKRLYWPAIAALRFNPAVSSLGKRLKAKGKHPLAIIAAAMRKLIQIAFGVLKSAKPFDPTLAGA